MNRLPYPALGGVLVFAALLSACVGATTFDFDPSPVPSQTSPPTATAASTDTPLPSATPTQTASPPPSATQISGTPTLTPIVLLDVKPMLEAGFAFQPVEGFKVTQYSPEQVTLTSPDERTILSMSSIVLPGRDPLEDMMRRLLEPIAENFVDFSTSDPYPIEVDEKPGLATDLSAKFSDQFINGQVLLVRSSDTRVFSALSIVVELDDDPTKGASDRAAIKAIIDSVDFIEPDE